MNRPVLLKGILSKDPYDVQYQYSYKYTYIYTYIEYLMKMFPCTININSISTFKLY